MCRFILATLFLLATVLSGTAASACGDHVDVTEMRAFSTNGRTSSAAAYLTIENVGAKDHTLVSAESDIAAITDIHLSRMEDGVMRMAPAGPLSIKQGQTLVMEPGGLHIMLIRLKRPLTAGETFPLTLTFAHGKTMDVLVDVIDR